MSVILKCFSSSRAKPKKAEDETVRRRSMRLQRVEPSGAPMPEMPAQPEAEEYVRWGGVRDVCACIHSFMKILLVKLTDNTRHC